MSFIIISSSTTSKAESDTSTNSVNGWNEELDEVIEEWVKEYSFRSARHSVNQSKYNKYNNTIFFAALIFVSISSILQLISSTPEFPQIVTTAGGIVNVFSIFVLSIKEYYRFGKLSIEHKYYSALFNEFVIDLKILLAMNWKRRPPGKTVLKSLKERLDKLLIQAPSISLKEFRRSERNLKEQQEQLDAISITPSSDEDEVNPV